MSTTLVNPGSGTTLEDAIANQLADSTDMVARLRANDQFNYDQSIRNFDANMESGQPNVNEKPPVAPFAWVLSPPNAAGFVFYERSNTIRLTSSIPIDTFDAGAPQAPKPLNVIDIGKSINGTKWYSVGPMDTFPLGMTTPPQTDGHTYQKFGAPVGAGWYLQVS